MDTTETVRDLTDVDARLQQLEERFPARDISPGAQVTRVAPSPTGKPHIGTALQAVIDFALARQSNGVFILRIEDTDRQRLVPGAVEAIVEALHWLGVPPDEGPGAGGEYGPYVESERLGIYHAVVDWLVARGRAYLCFCTPERLAQMREAQIAAKQPTRYDRHCRYLSEEERQAHLHSGETPVVRLAMPVGGTVTYEDPVRGEIEFDASVQDDPVILKSDGFPTYHLAAMVDDHYMRVTTAVRGEEWVSSTPKHLVLFDALGWTPPRIAHTNILRDAQRRKLGKRTGDTSISWYRAQGYPPEAFRNFITRIIWPHPEGKDVYPFADFIRHISVESLPKTAPVVDLALLDSISGEWLRLLGPAELFDATVTWLEWTLREYPDGLSFGVQRKQERVEVEVSGEQLRAFHDAFLADRGYSESVLTLEPERYSKYGDIVLQTPLFFPTLFVPATAEAVTEAARGDASLAADLLEEYLGWYTGEETAEEWEARMDEMAQRRELRRGVPFMTVRVAATGSRQTPPLYPTLRVLGAGRVRERVQGALDALRSSRG